MRPPKVGGKHGRGRGKEVDYFQACVSMVEFIEHHMTKLNSVGAMKQALYIWRKTHGWGLTEEAIGETELVQQAGVQPRAVKAYRKILPVAKHEELRGKVDAGCGPIYVVLQPSDETCKVRPRTRYAWPLSAEVLRLSNGKGGGGKNGPTEGAILDPQGRRKSTPTGRGQSDPTQSNTYLLSGTNTSSSDGGQTMIGSTKERKIVEVITSRFKLAQLSLPPGKLPVEEIAAVLSPGDYVADEIEQLGNALDDYTKHLKDPPRIWRHVTTSIKKWFSDKKRTYNPHEINYENWG